jgi:hypothetical protein
MADAICSVDGCEKQVSARGWCKMHWRRWRKHGDPMRGHPTVADRFWSKVDKTETCWLWTASIDGDGYGWFRLYGRLERSHRIAYELLIGPIPDGLQLDHLCRNRGCVNPDHLEPVPLIENVMRGEGPMAVNARKTHCIHGHEFTDANTDRSERGHRRCVTCRRERDRKRRNDRKRALATA